MNDFTCVAIPVRQGATTFYVAAVDVRELRTICRPLVGRVQTGVLARDTASSMPLTDEQLRVLVRSMQTSDFKTQGCSVVQQKAEIPYQRLLNEGRSREIARYMEEPSALLPNAIILATSTVIEEEMKITPLDSSFVRIAFPRSPESAVILDGQHRVAAFDSVRPELAASMQVVVTFLVGIPFYQQAEIFAVINGKQQPVNRSIIYDLFGYTTPTGGHDDRLYDGFMAVARFCSHTARILNQVEQSPWVGKVKMRGPGDKGVISQAAVVDYLSVLVEPKRLSPRLRILPVFYDLFRQSDAVSCASVLIVYLAAIRAAWSTEWSNPDTLFWKSNGVAVMFRILHDSVLLAGGSAQLMDQYQGVVDRWSRAPKEHILRPPRTGGGGVQNQLYEIFRGSLFSKPEMDDLSVRREELQRALLAGGGLVE